MQHRITWPTRLLAGLAVSAMAASCTDGASPTSTAGGAVQLAIKPQFHVTSVSSEVMLQRARVTITDSDRGQRIAGPIEVSLDPTARSWSLPVTFEVETGHDHIAALVELLSIADGVPVPQWSGVTSTVALNDAVTAPLPVTVQMYQGPPDNLTVREMRIDSTRPALIEGDSVYLRAHPIGGGARPHVYWKSSDTAVAHVDDNGVVRTHRDGLVFMKAEAGQASDSIRLHVRARPVVIRAVTDTFRASSLGEETVVRAEVLDRRGVVIADDSIVSSSSDASVVESLGNGRFIARGNGTAVIHICSWTEPSVSTDVAFTVKQRVASISLDASSFAFEAPGQTHRFTAVPRDARDNIVADATVDWSSSDARVATVDANGTATAVSSGSASIVASSADGAQGAVQITVARKVSTVSVSPSQIRFNALGDTARATFTARDPVGNPITGLTVAWTSSAPNVVSVDANGLVRALANGSARIDAAVDGLTASTNVTVSQVAAAIDVQPDSIVADSAGAAMTFTARVTDARGNLMSNVPLTWTASNTDVVTAVGGGSFVARENGTATITAKTAEGDVGGTARAIVRIRIAEQPRAATVTLDAVAFTLAAPGDTRTIQAIVRDEAGAPLTDAPLSWSSDNNAVAVVDNNGVVTGVAAGVANITATSPDGPHATATVTVLQPRLPVAVTVDPATATLHTGESTQATATVANDTTGALSGVVWTSSSDAVATVDSTGRITAVATGSATITGTSRFDASAHATVSVVVLPATVVTLAPASATLTIGDTLALTGTLNGTGDVIALGLAYTSSNPAVAIVDRVTGSVIALTAGKTTITARAVSDTSHIATSVITVVPPAAAILSVLTDKGQAVDLSSVKGPIVVTALVTAVTNPIKTVETGMDSNVECSASFSPTINPGQGASTVQCKIRTEARSNGTQTYPDGPHTIFVRAIDTNNVASITRISIVTNN